MSSLNADPFEIRSTGSPVGAEIVGLDLSRPLAPDIGMALKQALAEKRVLVFRDQALAPDDQVRVMRGFGRVIDEMQDGSCFSLVSGEESSLVNPGRLLFHSDNHFTPLPLEALSLYAEQMGDAAAPTLFVDNVHAYARLPDDLRRAADAARILNVSYYFWGQGGHRPARSVYPQIPEAPRTTHPMVWRHPTTGQPMLYLTELHACQVEGMDLAESDALLARLHEVLYEPAAMYTHVWRQGDLVIWDNRASQHARGPMPQRRGDPTAPKRILRRVVVGEKGFHEQVTLPAAVQGAR